MYFAVHEIMDVTKLIQIPEVKSFLKATFPKPVINTSKCCSISRFANVNPSLTGNAYEIFFEILLFKKNNDVKRKILLDKPTIQRNLQQIDSEFPRVKRIMFDDLKYQLLRLVTKKTHLEHIHDFKYIAEKNFQNIYYLDRRKYKNVAIHKPSLDHFLKSSLNNFETDAKLFITKRKLTPKFIKAILVYTQLRSTRFNFANGKEIVDKFIYKDEYLDYIFELFSITLNKYNINYSNIKCQPQLHVFNLSGRVDFKIDDQIVDAKSGKKVLSLDDYNQAITYLLLAQTPQNKRKWGPINRITLYYALYDHEVVIDKSWIKKDQAIALKFLREQSMLLD